MDFWITSISLTSLTTTRVSTFSSVTEFCDLKAHLCEEEHCTELCNCSTWQLVFVLIMTFPWKWMTYMLCVLLNSGILNGPLIFLPANKIHLLILLSVTCQFSWVTTAFQMAQSSLENVRNYSPTGTVSHSKRLVSSSSLWWQP
jgi:hypothetical protein